MKNYKPMPFLMMMALLLAAGPAIAQAQQTKKSKKATTYYRMYDTTTVETLKGTVTSLEKMASRSGMRRGYGVHVILDTGNETIPVHLGPSWFLDKQDVKVLKGDKIEVIGSRITYDNNPAIVAAEVKKGTDVLKLRDDKGFPNWSGWRNKSK